MFSPSNQDSPVGSGSRGGAMALLRRGVVTALTLGVLSTGGALSTGGGRSTRMVPARAGTPQQAYGINQKERYLSTDDFNYIRPGFHITVNSVTIPSDNRPIVDMTFF